MDALHGAHLTGAFAPAFAPAQFSSGSAQHPGGNGAGAPFEYPPETPSVKRRRLEDSPRINGVPTGNRYATLPIEETDEEDEEYDTDASTESEPEPEASNLGVSDTEAAQGLHSELADILPRKTQPDPPGRKGKKRGRTTTKRSTHTKSCAAIKEAVTGRRVRRKHVDIENVDPLSSIPAPSSTSTPAPSISRTASESSKGDGQTPDRKSTKNFIYEFWFAVDDNPARRHPQPGDRHYQCRHVKPGERPKIVTLTKKGNGSVNGLVKYLEHHWSDLYQMYEEVRKRQPEPKLTVQELRIARGELAADDTAVQAYFEGLQQKGEEIISYLDCGTFDQDVFELHLSEWIAACDQPFQEIERPELQRVLQYVRGQTPLEFPSADTIKRRVMDLSKTSIDETKAMIRNIQGMVSLSIDAWTSSNGFAFLAVVMHYVTEDWQLEELLIDFRELVGDHSGENLATAVWDTLELYDLKGQIMAINSDNTSNNDTMMDALEHRCRTHKPVAIPFSAKVARMRCVPHTVHLAALQLLESIGAVPAQVDTQNCQECITAPHSEDYNNFVATHSDETRSHSTSSTIAGHEETSADRPGSPATANIAAPPSIAYEMVGKAIEKLRKIIRAVRSSPQRRQTWLRCVHMAAAEDSGSAEPMAEGSESHARANMDDTIPVQDKPEAAKLLILDVKTRWSSTHQMLKRALEYIKAIRMFVGIAPKDAKLEQVSNAEWDAIARVEMWLDSFREATTLMLMTKGLTLSSVLSVFRDLQDDIRNAYRDLPLSAPPVLKQGLLNAHRKLSDYYYLTDASPYYIWASLLDPRISMQGLMRDFSQDDEADSEIQHLRQCRDQLEAHYRTNYIPKTPPRSEATPAVAASSLPVKRRFDVAARYSTSTASMDPNDELAHYFLLNPDDAIRLKVDPLKWWQTNQDRFPNLSRLARDIFTIPGCVVAVERVFSSGRDTISLRRASLKPDTIRSLMLLKQKLLLSRESLKAALRQYRVLVM